MCNTISAAHSGSGLAQPVPVTPAHNRCVKIFNSRPFRILSAAIIMGSLIIAYFLLDGPRIFAAIQRSISEVGFPWEQPRTLPNPQSVDIASASVALESLETKGRAPKTGYSRVEFGPPWADVDGNRCDTRNDILARDLQSVSFEQGICTVATGVLADPYTGKTIDFQRGPNSGAVQIDHLVALSDAWQKGAQTWTSAKRLAFANDPLNLLAVEGPANASKSDADAATWLPPNKGFRCSFVAGQVQVKSVYGLWVTAAEKDAIRRVLLSCG